MTSPGWPPLIRSLLQINVADNGHLEAVDLTVDQNVENELEIRNLHERHPDEPGVIVGRHGQKRVKGLLKVSAGTRTRLLVHRVVFYRSALKRVRWGCKGTSHSHHHEDVYAVCSGIEWVFWGHERTLARGGTLNFADARVNSRNFSWWLAIKLSTRDHRLLDGGPVIARVQRRPAHFARRLHCKL